MRRRINFREIALFLAVLLCTWVALDAPRADAQEYASELECLAKTIYYEGRSEPPEGQAAIGQVVMNRMFSDRFPNTICDVVQQGGEEQLHKCQFSWYCDGKPDTPYNPEAWVIALELAESFLEGSVYPPAQGALHYHAEYVRPSWADNLRFIGQFGTHLFYGPEQGMVAATVYPRKEEITR